MYSPSCGSPGAPASQGCDGFLVAGGQAALSFLLPGETPQGPCFLFSPGLFGVGHVTELGQEHV